MTTSLAYLVCPAPSRLQHSTPNLLHSREPMPGILLPVAFISVTCPPGGDKQIEKEPPLF